MASTRERFDVLWSPLRSAAPRARHEKKINYVGKISSSNAREPDRAVHSFNKLKKSPKNARKVPNSEAAIEAYAASIAAEGILQNLVVEPEVDAEAEGTLTGFYFVTIREGRRLAQLLPASVSTRYDTWPRTCVDRIALTLWLDTSQILLIS
jgi:hypothetical protein